MCPCIFLCFESCGDPMPVCDRVGVLCVHVYFSVLSHVVIQCLCVDGEAKVGMSAIVQAFCETCMKHIPKLRQFT